MDAVPADVTMPDSLISRVFTSQDPTPLAILNIQHGGQPDGITGVEEVARTEYISLLIMLDDVSIPAWWTLLAIFFTRILLVGFVLFPISFASWERSTSIPIYVVACICTTIAEAGMLWVCWQWRKRHVWVLRSVLFPGLLNSITGVILTIAHVSLHATALSTTSKSILGLVFGTAVIYTVLLIAYCVLLLRKMVRCRAIAPEERLVDETTGSSLGLHTAIHHLWSNQRRGALAGEMPITEYVRMLNAAHDIPVQWNILSTFFTWLSLIGFVLSPITFSPAGTGSTIPLYITTWTCIGAGTVGMTWAWWKWHGNYVWILHYILLPGLLNSVIGVISTVTNVYGAQHGNFTTASKMAVVATAAIALVCTLLFDNTYHRLGLMKRWHRVHVIEQARGQRDSPTALRHPTTLGQGVNDRVLIILTCDSVHAYWISFSALFSRLLLVGFVLLPAVFSSWESSISRAIYVIAWAFTGIGIAGMSWTWWKWRQNYAWTSRHVVVPGLLNSLAGIISVLANVYGSQFGIFSATSMSALILTAFLTLVFVIFSIYEMSVAANGPPIGGVGRNNRPIDRFRRTLSWLFDVEYTNIVDDWHFLATFSTWILLVGLVLFPASFSFRASSRMPIAAWVCSGTGAVGMVLAWLAWRKDYVWTLHHVLIPGLLNSLTGLISILANVYGAQNGTFSATSTSALIMAATIALACAVLSRLYNKIILKILGWPIVRRCPFADPRRLTSEFGLSEENYRKRLTNRRPVVADPRRPIF